jgi:hypothetical protein
MNGADVDRSAENEAPGRRDQIEALIVRLQTDAQIRYWALLVAGIVGWVLVVLNYPLEDAVPRYAAF